VRVQRRPGGGGFSTADSYTHLPQPTIYRVPLVLEEAGFAEILTHHLEIPAQTTELADCRALVEPA